MKLFIPTISRQIQLTRTRAPVWRERFVQVGKQQIDVSIPGPRQNEKSTKGADMKHANMNFE